jgi:hypothetical protein
MRTDERTDRKTDRQKYRQTDRKTDRQRHTDGFEKGLRYEVNKCKNEETDEEGKSVIEKNTEKIKQEIKK